MSRPKKISFWGVVILTVVAVDSLRNLPTAAMFGDVLIGYYILAGVFFLLPAALVSAELASRFDDAGGIYSWVKAAFGSKMGVYAVWLQWIENVIWYPAILSFIVATCAYVLVPDLAENTKFLACSILAIFTLMTLLNCRGIMHSVRFSEICLWLGLVLPMLCIIGLGCVWYFHHYQHMALQITPASFLPNIGHTEHIMSITAIGLSLCGIEVATVHTKDVENPKKTFPPALILSAIIIVFTLILGSLAIAAVLPQNKISLVAGIMQAFNAFFTAYHLKWLLPFMAIALVIGGLGAVNNWIIAPARGLMVAAQDHALPKIFTHVNRANAPVSILVGQVVVVGGFCLLYLYFPAVNESYWLLTVLASQLYMVMYAIMFLTCMILRWMLPIDKQAFSIPGGKLGCCIVCGMGLIGVGAIFLAGFVPPPTMHFGSHTHYYQLLITCLVLLSLPPFLLMRFFGRS